MPPHPSPPLAPLKAQRRIMPVLKQEVFAKSFCCLSLCYSCKETHVYVLQPLQILLQISWLSSHTKRPQEFGNFVSLSTVWQYITAPFFMKTYVRKWKILGEIVVSISKGDFGEVFYCAQL